MNTRVIKSQSYTLTAITLHWLVATFVFTLISLGWYMTSLPEHTPKGPYYFQLHKSIGLLAGTFILLRLLWRLSHRPPSLPYMIPTWQVKAAEYSHTLLYLSMVLMPLSGYLGANFGMYGVKFFGMPLPAWGSSDKEFSKEISDLFFSIHVAASYVFVTLISIHILAVLKHIVWDKDSIFRRMIGLPPH